MIKSCRYTSAGRGLTTGEAVFVFGFVLQDFLLLLLFLCCCSKERILHNCSVESDKCCSLVSEKRELHLTIADCIGFGFPLKSRNRAQFSQHDGADALVSPKHYDVSTSFRTGIFREDFEQLEFVYGEPSNLTVVVVVY